MWYLAQRSLQMLVILVILSAALFGLLSAMPGNPVDLMITSNPQVKPEDVIRLKKLRGLDRPWYVQYVRWLWGYPEPVKPPVIRTIDAISSSVDLSDKLIDPNFIPDSDWLAHRLSELYPLWSKSLAANKIKDSLSKNDLSSFLLNIANLEPELQNRIVNLIEHESARYLKIEVLFGARLIDKNLMVGQSVGPDLYFKLTNSYGQEKVGRVALSQAHPQSQRFLMPIKTQVLEDDSKPFKLDLGKFLAPNMNRKELKFSLLDSPGQLSEDGFYEHSFSQPGQQVIKIAVSNNQHTQNLAFDIEHGVIGHPHRFNRGFLYFFVGDHQALGFSQTYKRPVYDLLFGSPPVCGDGRIDAGETCDDGNLENSKTCDANCYRAEESFITKADATISGYLVRSGRIGNTVQLMLPALLLSLLIAIPLGIFSAYRQYSIADYLINFLTFIGISLPVFWFGIMMIYLFAEAWQIFPAGGVQTPGIYGQGSLEILLDRLNHAILPTMVLSIFYVGSWLRYMRASMLEVLPADYIRTARAKGLSERIVILRHAFRNALIPVVTVLALSIPALFGGAVLTETVFSWPGVGRLQYDAVMNSDYYVAIVVFLVSAVLVMIGNLLADALYLLVDPRIRKQ